jgi:hypothetical protein
MSAALGLGAVLSTVISIKVLPQVGEITTLYGFALCGVITLLIAFRILPETHSESRSRQSTRQR